MAFALVSLQCICDGSLGTSVTQQLQQPPRADALPTPQVVVRKIVLGRPGNNVKLGIVGLVSIRVFTCPHPLLAATLDS